MAEDAGKGMVNRVITIVFGIIIGVLIFSLVQVTKVEEVLDSPRPDPGEEAVIEEKQEPFAGTSDLEKAEREREETENAVLKALAETESKKKSPPTSEEMPFASPVPGNPLVVILPGEHAGLGRISVEKYSNEGEATGKPLKRGTQVQIPDPNRPGEKIYFKVP